jgi:hypothetical protein
MPAIHTCADSASGNASPTSQTVSHTFFREAWPTVPQSSILRPRIVALDTSHLAAFARDKFSGAGAKATARAFEQALIDAGAVLLLSWHHLAELLRHKNQAVASTPLAFIQSLPNVA